MAFTVSVDATRESSRRCEFLNEYIRATGSQSEKDSLCAETNVFPTRRLPFRFPVTKQRHTIARVYQRGDSLAVLAQICIHNFILRIYDHLGEV